ncbi:hypothetical protein JTB14_027207 [Gonioctena quinquepunctata]|nr:hypothetical protein JTB14_027207 [Gonioctena quinquepunctata]
MCAPLECDPNSQLTDLFRISRTINLGEIESSSKRSKLLQAITYYFEPNTRRTSVILGQNLKDLLHPVGASSSDERSGDPECWRCGEEEYSPTSLANAEHVVSRMKHSQLKPCQANSMYNIPRLVSQQSSLNAWNQRKYHKEKKTLPVNIKSPDEKFIHILCSSLVPEIHASSPCEILPCRSFVGINLSIYPIQ